MSYAPIVLFTYSRADHTQKAVESLLQNREAAESELYIYTDGPKTEAKRQAVEENRKYIHSITGFKSVHIVEREKNWGLAKSLIAGITEIVNKYGQVIVVEDDLIVSPYFLQYMNEALEKYRNEERVASISAFLNPIDCEAPETFFLRYFACWGWATWKRGWDLLINDDRELLRRLRWKKNDFNIDGSGPFYGILYCDKVGLNDSWAVRFYASQFLAGKFQLFPGHTLVIQSGTDGTGTHCIRPDDKFSQMQFHMQPIELDDIPVVESSEMYKAFSRFYMKGKTTNKLRNMIDRIKSFLRRLLGIDYR